MSLKKIRVTKVKEEIKRLSEAIKLMESDLVKEWYSKYDEYGHGVYTGQVKCASLGLIRSLVSMRKSSYDKILGEK